MNSSSFYQPQQNSQSNHFADVLNAVKQKLYESIITLNSDQALKQLNFSPDLSQFKYDRIRQILNDTFNLSQLLEQATFQVAKYKNKCEELEVQLQVKDRQHLLTLQQFKNMFNEYKHSTQIERMNLHSIYNQSNNNNQKQQQQLQLQKRIEHQHEEIAHYKMSLRSMQQDMLRIKNEWQKRCRQIEIQSQQQSRYLIEQSRRDAQAKLDIWLREMQKQNGQIIIRQDKLRMQQQKRQHLKQIKRLKQNHQRTIEQLQQRIEQSRLNQKRQKDEVVHYISKLNQLKSQNQSRQQTIRKQNTILRNQIEIITNKSQEYERQKIKQDKKIATQTDNLVNKLDHVSQIVQSKQHQIIIIKEKLMNYQTIIKELKDVKYKLTVDISDKDAKNIQLQARLFKTNQKQKRYKQKIKNIQLRLEGVRLGCSRLKNSMGIQKDQIKYQLDSYKRRISTFADEVSRFVWYQLQKSQTKYTTKLNSLMYQLDANQKNQNMALEQALKDNQYLRGQLKDYEQVFQQKMEEARRQKQMIREDMEEEIEELRRKIMKMVSSISRQKEDMYIRVKQQLQQRDRQINRLDDQKRNLIETINELKRKYQSMQNQVQQSKKQKKHTQRQLRETKAELMVKSAMIEEYTKQGKHKQNIRSNMNTNHTNRQQKEKQMEEIRVMLAKTYEAVGSELPQKHRRKH